MNKQKKWCVFFIMLMVCACVFSAVSFAAWDDEEDFEEGDFTCRLVDRGNQYKVAIVKYNGTDANVKIPQKIDGIDVDLIVESAFENCDFIESVEFPSTLISINKNAFQGCSSLKKLNLPEGLTGLGNYAFRNCSSLEEVVLPKGLSAFGSQVFVNCTSLRSVNIPAHAYLSRIDYVGPFYGCTSLTEVTFEEGINQIYYRLFDGCSALSDIEIPDTVKTIDKYAFRNCTALKSIVLPDSVETIGDLAFAYSALQSIDLPDSVKTIGDSAFRSCTNLKTISIPDSVTTIKAGAFMNCGFESFTWPENVTAIDLGTFALCPALNSISIPESVVSIGSNAFEACSSLKNVRLPNSITDINSSAFLNCTALESITIPHSVAKLDNEAFKDCSALKEIVIPESITEFGYSIFKGCTSLEKVTFPNNLNSVPSEMFWGCSSLNNVIIPDSCTSISSRAFMDCKSLDSITLPESIQEIGYGAFSNTAFHSFSIPAQCTELRGTFLNCSNLETVIVNEGLKSIGAETFKNCTNLRKIILPDGLEKIDNAAFANDQNLVAIIIPASVSDIFYGFGYWDYEKCKNVTIYGYSGSYAEKYASENSIPFRSMDDYSFYIITQPYSVAYPAGQYAGLGVVVQGYDLSYQWQVLSDNKWKNVEKRTIEFEINGDSHTVEYSGKEDSYAVSDTDVGNIYRCLITDIEGTTIVSDEAEVFASDDDFGWFIKNGTAMVAGYFGEENEVEIPSQKNGMPVTSIGSLNSGLKESTITMVRVPNTVTEILDYAFIDCKSLEGVLIPESVTKIADVIFDSDNTVSVLGYSGSYAEEYCTDRNIPFIRLDYEMCISKQYSTSHPQYAGAVVEVEGYGLSYQWQVFSDNQWKNAKKTTVEIDMGENSYSEDFSGKESMYYINQTTEDSIYRCVITDFRGKQLISDEMKLTLSDDDFGWVFQNGAAMVQGYFGKEKEAVIPSQKNGVSVTGIGYMSNWYESDITSVRVPKTVTEIREYAFLDCTSLQDIYYQGSKAQWDRIDGSEYLDEQFVVHYNSDEVTQIAEDLGHNLNLSGSIGFNYYLHLSDQVLEDEGAIVHFDLPNGLTSEMAVKDAKVVTVKGVECREFGCKLHSSQMTGTVKAKVVLSDGTESEEFPYTIKEYADLIIENPDNNEAFTKVTPLIKAMLNYGGYAQAYFKYDNNPLANKDLTAEERNAIQAVTAEEVKNFERVVTGSQEGLKYEGTNLMLTSETCIRHFFTVQSGHDISEYSFKLDGKTLTPVKSGKMYYVEISNIASGNLDKTYTVTAGGITIQYSAMSYVYTQLGKTDLDPDLANTLKALYLYNQEANEYYGK